MARSPKPDGEGETTVPEQPTEDELEAMRVADLEAAAEERGVMPDEGSGKGGAVVKDDLIEALAKPESPVQRARRKQHRPAAASVARDMAMVPVLPSPTAEEA